MRYFPYLLLLFLIGNIEAFSQNDYRNGYIINNNNDTIHGFINYKGNRANAKMCHFKKEINSEVQEFSPNDIKAYRFIDNKFYVSKLLKPDSNDKLFLEILIDGIADIYYYRDNIGEHYLIDNGDGKLYELKNDEKEVVINNQKFVRRSKEYIGMLRYFFSSAPSLSQEIDNTVLNHKSLIRITEKYHKQVCTNEECIVYEKKLPKKKALFGPILGLNVTNVSVVNNFTDDYYYLRNSHFQTAIYPSIGLFYNNNLFYWNERLNFQYEITYRRVNLKSSSSFIGQSTGINYQNDIKLIQNSINNSFILEYEFTNYKIRPSIQLGGFVNYYFSNNYKRNLVALLNNDVFLTVEYHKYPFSKYDYGVNIGVGFKGKLTNNRGFFIDMRYQRGMGLLKNISTNNYSINIGINISK